MAGYVELVRDTPFLVQLFFIYFGLPVLGVRLDPIHAALLAMILNMTAYATEIIGAGLDAVPGGQRDAAKALGLPRVVGFTKVVLPQAFSFVRAPTVGFLVQLTKAIAVTSIIGFPELVRVSGTINNV